ncbi:MAG: hypothetical protein NVSMB57_08540 [Actinomycetota bacterium]
MGVARDATPERLQQAATRAGVALKATRPTAVNLGWAVDRMLAVASAAAATGADGETMRKIVRAEALAIHEEDGRSCKAMAEAGQRFVEQGATVMTHCNTGFLCTGGYGTALGVIRLAHELGKQVRVIAGETRPLLQGARLTAWELGRLGIPYSLVPDSATASILASGDVSLVIVGADRIAANGDVANKIGTYSLALAAQAAGVPFVVVAPTSTIDPRIAGGAEIEIEQRDEREVLQLGKRSIAPKGAHAVNPAFDVTPARYITAIVTERGTAMPPGASRILALSEAGLSSQPGAQRLQ